MPPKKNDNDDDDPELRTSGRKVSKKETVESFTDWLSSHDIDMNPPAMDDIMRIEPEELADEIERRHGIGETIPSLIKDFLKFCRIMPSDAEAAAEATFTKIAASHLCDYDSFEYLIEAGFDVARSIEHPIPDWDSRVVSHNSVVIRELKCHVCFEWTLNSGCVSVCSVD